jgi:hypothetical protein
VKFADPIAWEQSLPVRPSSLAWRAIIKATYGTPLDGEELELFRSLTNREPPQGGTDELLVVAGRRGGKSETIARVATFEAVHGGHAVALAPGQVALIPVISPLREQSGEIVRYVQGLAALPQLRKFVDGEPTRDGIRFKTGVEIRVMTADAVAVSGPTIVCAIKDELAKHPGAESAMPDTVTDAALRPALAPVVGAPRRRMIGITSAYIRDGLAYETDRDHFGVTDSPVLVARGTTEQFNPNIDKAWLERELRRVGPLVFAREYLAQWQDAVTNGWFGTVIDKCVDKGRESSEAAQGHLYVAAIDAAFKGDKFALAIAHLEQRDGKPVAVLDHVEQWEAPTNGALDVRWVVGEAASVISEYRACAYADQFSFIPLRELFSQCSVALTEAPWTGTSKPQMFGRVRNNMTNGGARLCDNRALIGQFYSIQGRLLKSGGERLEARIGHDDLVHAAVMALYFAEEMDGIGRAYEEANDWAERQNRTRVRDVGPMDWNSTYDRQW